MRVCANLPLPGRDLRLDLSRGLANWAIFLDHIPHEVMNSITTRNYGFSDAADLFVFISGYTAACVFGRMMIEQGYVAAAWGLFKRTAKLYAAHMACTSAADQVRSEFASGVLYRHRSCVLCPRCHRAKPEFSWVQIFVGVTGILFMTASAYMWSKRQHRVLLSRTRIRPMYRDMKSAEENSMRVESDWHTRRKPGPAFLGWIFHGGIA
jgi:hypothetical protein